MSSQTEALTDLELIFLEEAADVPDDIHHACPVCTAVICGRPCKGESVPRWFSITCEVCKEMSNEEDDKPKVIKCKSCEMEFVI